MFYKVSTNYRIVPVEGDESHWMVREVFSEEFEEKYPNSTPYTESLGRMPHWKAALTVAMDKFNLPPTKFEVPKSLEDVKEGDDVKWEDGNIRHISPVREVREAELVVEVGYNSTHDVYETRTIEKHRVEDVIRSEEEKRSIFTEEELEHILGDESGF